MVIIFNKNEFRDRWAESNSTFVHGGQAILYLWQYPAALMPNSSNAKLLYLNFYEDCSTGSNFLRTNIFFAYISTYEWTDKTSCRMYFFLF